MLFVRYIELIIVLIYLFIGKQDVFFFNHPEDISFNLDSVVAMANAVGLDQCMESNPNTV